MEFAENKSMEKPKYKDLLFDVDGTLLDFAAAEEHGLRQVFAPFGDLMEPMTEAYQILNKQLWEDFEKGLITKEDITQTRFRRILKNSALTRTEWRQKPDTGSVSTATPF